MVNFGNSNLNNPLLLPALNFPQYKFRIRKKESKGLIKEEVFEIFDSVRKKFVILNPEEWVRQHLLEYLIKEKNFPLSLLAVEKQLELNKTKRRTDIMAYSSAMKAVLIAECKAPEITLDMATLNQVLRYNLVYNVSNLIVTNGMQHFFFYRNTENEAWQQGNEFPEYGNLLKII